MFFCAAAKCKKRRAVCGKQRCIFLGNDFVLRYCCCIWSWIIAMNAAFQTSNNKYTIKMCDL